MCFTLVWDIVHLCVTAVHNNCALTPEIDVPVLNMSMSVRSLW
jgi:hypothetical protein